MQRRIIGRYCVQRLILRPEEGWKPWLIGGAMTPVKDVWRKQRRVWAFGRASASSNNLTLHQRQPRIEQLIRYPPSNTSARHVLKGFSVALPSKNAPRTDHEIRSHRIIRSGDAPKGAGDSFKCLLCCPQTGDTSLRTYWLFWRVLGAKRSATRLW